MVYKWYILPIGGLYATYHLLREPKTTIESPIGSMYGILPGIFIHIYHKFKPTLGKNIPYMDPMGHITIMIFLAVH